MKRILLPFLIIGFIRPCDAQTKLSSNRYPSLFWEITGNGLSRPSYLFGTMHVSSKMVFHLPDSFYLGIKNVDVVALETNPESWQEDLVKYDVDDNAYGRTHSPWNNFRQVPDDYLHIQTLQFKTYEKQIEAALYSRPSTINNLLYRNYSDYSSDFEENTYLDMYIYQVGKKMGKRVAGVERYDESMKLMMEAYRDAAKDKEQKERSYDRDDSYSADKLQEAYRAGNLDLLDSINRLNSFSNAFDEKFLYSRNYLQANSIDSILKSKSSLFVGVGAAHLPGKRGVIEILRAMGYTLRPIVMGERDSQQKDIVEKLRVAVNFTAQTSDDGFFKVDVPGKFYRFNEEGLLDQLQYADMANGSYYMVTRIKTNSQFWGHSTDIVMKKIDSLLYENIPGKILNKQEISRDGYRGLDITNLTRRGDVQRYNIFITPYEVIIFKMSGNGDYVKQGDESKRFFNSIQLKEYKTDAVTEWKRYEPPFGGFSINLPHDPFVSKNESWQYAAEDKTTATNYTIIRTDIHNYGFVEEDSFDLNLLEESFSHSAFIAKQLSRKLHVWKGYPSLDCKWLHKDGSLFLTRFIIQGPHYYTLVAHSSKENAGMQSFLNSFRIEPLIYKEMAEKKDTSLYYTVKTTFYPEERKIKLSIPGGGRSINDTEDDDDEINLSNRGTFKNNIVENDSTGERVYVSFYKTGRYYYNEDSLGSNENRLIKNYSWIVRQKKKYDLPGDWKVMEFQLSDTNSSRLIWTKSLYKNGTGFFIATEGDTLTNPSSFTKTFFENFRPADTLTGFNPFVKKSATFFADFFSTDTLAHKRAINAIALVKVDSSDFPQLKKAIRSSNWSDKKYLDTKKSLINKLGDITNRDCSDYLKEIYYAAADTIEIQYAALESLLQQQTQYAFSVFKDIVTVEPPVLEDNASGPHNDFTSNRFRFPANLRSWANGSYDNGDFWDELYDSLKLTRDILPDILPLLNIDDYKWRTMRLLGRMVDSNLVEPHDYEMYFNKFFIEAKQELKKQAIAEKKKLIEKASTKTLKNEPDGGIDYGNDKLNLYARLVLPFWNNNPNVPSLFQQLLQSNDNKLKYNTLLLLIKKNKPVPDSLLRYFAARDEYRYSLYSDLETAKQLKFFPTEYNNHIDLGRSKLQNSKSYGKADSIIFLDKLTAEFRKTRGYVYFFKYKEKKDDVSWKLATVGLISKDPKKFEIKDTVHSLSDMMFSGNSWNYRDRYDFTSFTNTKLKANEQIMGQLEKQLKKMLYSKRQSAKEFYNEPNTDFDDYSMRIRD